MTTAAISLSTHVLDTGAGKPADGVLVVLYRGDMFIGERCGRTPTAARNSPTTSIPAPTAWSSIRRLRSSSGSSSRSTSTATITSRCSSPRSGAARSSSATRSWRIVYGRGYVDELAGTHRSARRRRGWPGAARARPGRQTIATHPADRRAVGGAASGAEPEVLAELARLNDEYEQRLRPVRRLVNGAPRRAAPRCSAAGARAEELDQGLKRSAQLQGQMNTDYLEDLTDLRLRILLVNCRRIASISAWVCLISINLASARRRRRYRGRVLGMASG